MPGITDPAEEYFKDGVWAWVTDQWKKLVADASNFLQVNIAAQDIDVEVKQTTAADLTPGAMGWDGSVWRKLPLVWGHSDSYVETELVTDATAGSNTLTFSTVPSGEVWILHSVLAANLTTIHTRTIIYPFCAGLTRWLHQEFPSAVLQSTEWHGRLVLKAGDYLEVYFEGCTLNDDIRAYAFGSKMKVAE